MKLIWVIRWKDLAGWQYFAVTFSTIQEAKDTAFALDIAWPVDIVPELRAA